MNIYKQVFKLGLKKAYQYHANFYLGLISFIFPFTIQYFLWTGLFKASEGKYVFGYTLYQMLSYVVFACITTKVISTNFVYEINEDIKNGGLAKYLIRPVDYFTYNLANYAGEKIGTIITSSIMVFVVCGIFYNIDSNIISIINIPIFFCTVMLAIILNFMIFYCISGLGFWMRDASGAIFITTLVGTIVSGGILPLDIFSTRVQFLLKLLPFPYTSYFPVSILCNRAGNRDVARGILLQFFWIGVCYFITKVIWKIGTEKYVSVGG